MEIQLELTGKGQETIERMKKEYGLSPKEVLDIGMTIVDAYSKAIGEGFDYIAFVKEKDGTLRQMDIEKLEKIKK